LNVSVEWVDVAMEEYKTLRAESLGSLEQAQLSLQIGLAAIAAITAFGATRATNVATLEDVAIAVASPLVAALVWVLWLLQVERAVLAGAQIALVEQRVNKHFPGEVDALEWERKMLEEHSAMGPAFERAVPLTLLATTIPSTVVGLVGLHHHHHEAWLLIAAAIYGVVLVLAIGYYRRVVEPRVKKIRTNAASKIKATGAQGEVSAPPAQHG
jgi:hypothetical protein